MPNDATVVSLTDAQERLTELVRRVHELHERITITRNGLPKAVLMSVDELEGLELTLEIVSDAALASRISDGLTALAHGERGADLATVRALIGQLRGLRKSGSS